MFRSLSSNKRRLLAKEVMKMNTTGRRRQSWNEVMRRATDEEEDVGCCSRILYINNNDYKTIDRRNFK